MGGRHCVIEWRPGKGIEAGGWGWVRSESALFGKELHVIIWLGNCGKHLQRGDITTPGTGKETC